MHADSSDFSSVKFPKDRQATTMEMRRTDLEQIDQADYETTPVKDRFRDRSSASSQRKGVESQPALERNQSNLQMKTMKQSFRKTPFKELAAMRLTDAPRRNHGHSASSHQLSKSYLNSTCEYHGGKTLDPEADADGITEVDPYAQSTLTAARQSYYPNFEKHIENGE